MSIYMGMCIYLARPDKVEEITRLLQRQWPVLRRHGLVTDDPPRLYFARDDTGPFFTEVITWLDASGPTRAYWTPEINALWRDISELTESREGRMSISYLTVTQILVDATDVEAQTEAANGQGR